MSRESVLITAAQLAAQLAEHLDRVVLIDVGAAEGERSEGIAGAVPAELSTDFAAQGGGVRGNRPLPDIDVLEAKVRQWGIDDDSDIVLYDDKGNLQAARGWWTLRWAGLKSVRLLDGGLAAAKAEGLALAPLQPVAKSGTATLSEGNLPVLEADDAALYAAQGRLIDARPPKAFNGDVQDKKGGHIPGALSLPAVGNLDADGVFLSDEALRRRYPRNPDIGVSCGAGVSAAHNAAALAILGATVPVYIASWSGWSADPARPVAYTEVLPT